MERTKTMAKIAETSKTDNGQDWYLSQLHKVTVYLSGYNNAHKGKVSTTGKIDDPFDPLHVASCQTFGEQNSCPS